MTNKTPYIRRLVILLLTAKFYGIAASQEITFTKRPTQIQDVATQSLRCDMTGERTIQQQNQLVDRTSHSLKRIQDRTLTVTAISNGVPTQAQIVYGQSATQLSQPGDEQVEVTQPVSGNTYQVELKGDHLVILDIDGNTPTPEEEAIVRQSLQAFGKPNPLAQFLDGMRWKVGQSRKVPQEVARELLGLTGQRATTESLELQLAGIEELAGIPCGRFATKLKTGGLVEGQANNSMTMLMNGQLWVEATTCRTRKILLEGPVAISEVVGPVQGKFTVGTNGLLRVAVDAEYSQRR